MKIEEKLKEIAEELKSRYAGEEVKVEDGKGYYYNGTLKIKQPQEVRLTEGAEIWQWWDGSKHYRVIVTGVKKGAEGVEISYNVQYKEHIDTIYNTYKEALKALLTAKEVRQTNYSERCTGEVIECRIMRPHLWSKSKFKDLMSEISHIKGVRDVKRAYCEQSTKWYLEWKVESRYRYAERDEKADVLCQLMQDVDDFGEELRVLYEAERCVSKHNGYYTYHLPYSMVDNTNLQKYFPTAYVISRGKGEEWCSIVGAFQESGINRRWNYGTSCFELCIRGIEASADGKEMRLLYCLYKMDASLTRASYRHAIEEVLREMGATDKQYSEGRGTSHKTLWEGYGRAKISVADEAGYRIAIEEAREKIAGVPCVEESQWDYTSCCSTEGQIEIEMQWTAGQGYKEMRSWTEAIE